MKTARLLLALAVLALMPRAAAAQIPALSTGSWIIDGSASLTSTQVEDSERTTEIAIAPSLRYFIAPGFAIGGTVAFTHASNDDNSSRTLAIGPAAAYFFTNVSESHVPFVSGSFIFGTNTTETATGDVESDEMRWRVSGGLLSMLTSSVGITTELFYQNRTLEAGEGPIEVELESNSFGLAVGIAAFVF